MKNHYVWQNTDTGEVLALGSDEQPPNGQWVTIASAPFGLSDVGAQAWARRYVSVPRDEQKQSAPVRRVAGDLLRRAGVVLLGLGDRVALGSQRRIDMNSDEAAEPRRKALTDTVANELEKCRVLVEWWQAYMMR